MLCSNQWAGEADIEVDIREGFRRHLCKKYSLFIQIAAGLSL
jgi:hypothetical protein